MNLTGSPDLRRRASASSAIRAAVAAATCTASSTRRPSRARCGTATASSRRHGYLRGCFQSALDLTIARNIRLGGARNLQLRVDMFNAPNQAIVTGRNTTMNLNNPADPTTITNLPYDAAGQHPPGPREAVQLRIRPGHRLADTAQHAVPDQILVVTVRAFQVEAVGVQGRRSTYLNTQRCTLT